MKQFHKNPTLVDAELIENESHTQLPESIGGYKIESLLNVGGMSLLYLGLHPETHEPITIKVLSKAYLSHPEIVEKFLHEAAIIEMANHPYIVKLHGHGKWEGGLYIAMEFVQGISLREMILQQTLSLKRALEIVMQIAEALSHLHAHGIIHRDLKPENVLLTTQGGIKVIDFGIAALYKTGSPKEKKIMGTPAYMSPEQREDPSKITYASDIYSLGVMTYELVLGRPSFGVIHLSQMPKGLQKILANALQSDPKARYQDVLEFRQEIENYLKSDEIKKDFRASDYLGEMSEKLKEAQNILVATHAPDWPRLDIAIASNTNTAISSVYIDFFQKQPGVYSIVLGESVATGMEGLLYIATLKGMVRSLNRVMESPKELISKLNDLLIEESKEETYSLAFLTLFPAENRFTYISCGYSPLWHVPSGADTPRRLMAENIALGISPGMEPFEVESNWHVGDTLILHTFQAGRSKRISDLEADESLFLSALNENLFSAPKQQVEALFRKISKPETVALFERPVTLISVGRKG